MSTFGDYIAEEMRRQGVNKLELERRTEIPDSTLGRILAGQEPKPTQIARIAQALGLKFWRLMQIGRYTDETPEDPDAELQRLAVVLQSRPKIGEIAREAETMTSEEHDAIIAYMRLLRQQRPRNRQKAHRRKVLPGSPEER